MILQYFPYTRVWECKFELAIEKSKINLESSFESTWQTLSPQCLYQDSALKFCLFWRSKFLSFFLCVFFFFFFLCVFFFYHIHVWVWGTSCLIMQNNLNKMIIPLRKKAHCEIWWKLLKLFQRTRRLKIIIFIHVYSPGARADNPWRQKFVVTKGIYFFDHT